MHGIGIGIFDGLGITILMMLRFADVLFGLLSEAIIPILAAEGLADRLGLHMNLLGPVFGMAGVVLVDRWFLS